jgi:type I site-specific restriction-modification system R (restriction) subunit
MKKLLLFAFYIFSSAFILPSDDSLDQLPEERRSATNLGVLARLEQFQEDLSREVLEQQQAQDALFCTVSERLKEELRNFKKEEEERRLGLEAINILRNSCRAVSSCIHDQGVSLEEVARKLLEGRQRIKVIGDMFKEDGQVLGFRYHYFYKATVPLTELSELDESSELEQLKKEAELHRLAKEVEEIHNESFKDAVYCVAGIGICPKDLVEKTPKKRERFVDILKAFHERGQEFNLEHSSVFFPVITDLPAQEEQQQSLCVGQKQSSCLIS